MCYSMVGKVITTSLCPVLGKMHAHVYNGMCPWHTESPLQKEIIVSFIGVRPYVTYTPIGGSDFILTRVFAKKHGFIPKFIPEKTVDSGKCIGMWHWVMKMCIIFNPRIFTCFNEGK